MNKIKDFATFPNVEVNLSDLLSKQIEDLLTHETFGFVETHENLKDFR